MRAFPGLAAAVLAIALASPALAGGPFVIDFVDDPFDVGLYTSIAVDDSGHVHVAYYDQTNGNLKYAKRVDGVWNIETVDDGGVANDVGQWASLVVGSDGVVHISYADDTNDNLKYAENPGGVWSSETVDDGGGLLSVGKYSAIGLDRLGAPVIAYADLTNNDLLLAQDSGGWVLTTIESTGDIGTYNSLVVDDYGNIHISSYRADLSRLHYFTRAFSSWNMEIIDVGTAGSYTSIALDEQGSPCIAYHASGSGDLKFASRKSRVWTYGPADNSAQVGRWTGLAIDKNGTPHISYYAVYGGDLKYATQKDGVWEYMIVEGPGDQGQYSSIALDKHGSPIIAYYDHEFDALKVADAGVDLTSPVGGETWSVGSKQTVSWRGRGLMNIELSSDGGSTWTTLATGVDGGNDDNTGSQEILVPHTPSRFSLIRIEREAPYVQVASDSFFTIETSVSLLMLVVYQPEGQGGNMIEWRSDPGPETLAGYRLDKRSGAGWTTLAALTSETTYHDTNGVPGDRYRLLAVNGLGEELLLGEAEASPQLVPGLTAWPVPFHSGELTVSFLVTGFGSATTPTTVDLYDVLGRRVRTIATGDYGEGIVRLTWDGTDASGRPVASGTYFLRVQSGANQETRKLVVLR